MPMDPIYFMCSLLKLIVSTVIPIALGIVADKTMLQNTSFMGIATLTGVIIGGIVMMMVLERISLGLKKHLIEQNGQIQT